MKSKQKSLGNLLKSQKSAFTLRRSQFAKISAVEGIELSEEMLHEFSEFDRKSLAPEERRQAIFRRYAKTT
jgi:hypothetical protein